MKKMSWTAAGRELQAAGTQIGKLRGGVVRDQSLA